MRCSSVCSSARTNAPHLPVLHLAFQTSNPTVYGANEDPAGPPVGTAAVSVDSVVSSHVNVTLDVDVTVDVGRTVSSMLQQRHAIVHSRDVALIMPDGMRTVVLVVEGLRVEVESEDGTSVLWQANSEVAERDGIEDWDGTVAVWMTGGVLKVGVVVDVRADVSPAWAEMASVATRSTACWRSFIAADVS